MKINQILRTFIGISLAFTLYACEDPIDINLDKGESQLAVDALVLVNDGPATIRLTKTTPYFENGGKAPGVSGALVQLTSEKGTVYTFTEVEKIPGNYVSSDSIRGETGEVFNLSIKYNEQAFFSTSRLVRGTPIDTLYQEERAAEFGNEAGKYLYFQATDPVGPNDFCWMRYSLNGQNDLRYNRLRAAFPVDAAFNPGAADGLEFIYPIRNSINGPKGYLIGDTLAVELLSIDAEQWRFLKEMDIQLNNTGLFASPIANVRGNIFNTDKNSKTKAVGCFGMARISRAGVRIK